MSFLDKLNFWVSCPDCKRKFGVPAETVFKYMDRLFEQLEQRTVKNAENFRARRDPEPPANLPIAEE